jgi:hypothetical protein
MSMILLSYLYEAPVFCSVVSSHIYEVKDGSTYLGKADYCHSLPQGSEYRGTERAATCPKST